MTIVAKNPVFLWPEAVNTTNYLINCSPSSANDGISFEEKYRDVPPHVGYFTSLAP